jgi:UDP-2,3-diacylglucosamine pyrophosphatase LpxH
MKVFISDLHLGDGSRTDDFHRDQELLKFLEFIEKEAQELIILGDFLELWQSDMDKVLFTHNEVISKLLSIRSRIKVTYVIGNHDYIPFIKFVNSGINISLEYRDTENNIVAEHGHKYDIFNCYKNPLKSIKWPKGRQVSLLLASIERYLHPDTDVFMKKALENMDEFLQQALFIRNKITPSSKEYLSRGGHFGEFKDAVTNHIKSGARIVIFGHTHRHQLETVTNGIYANCGAWADGSQPTYIACRKEVIELREAVSHNVIKKISL